MRPINKKLFAVVGIILFIALFSIKHFIQLNTAGMIIVTPVLGIATGYLYLALRKRLEKST